MASSACTIKDIRLTTVINGSKYHGGVSMDGSELGDVQLTSDFDASDHRTYICKNCKQAWDGSESFDEVKKHLGTFPID